jgi:hypothetical protein
MGAEPWSYVVGFEENIDLALKRLRRFEFCNGRFRNPKNYTSFPFADWSGATLSEIENLVTCSDGEDAAIEKIVEMAGESGTASILDMLKISDEKDFYTLSPLSQDVLLKIFDSEFPSNHMLTSGSMSDIWDEVEIGHGIYVIAYENNQPDTIHFMGYSFD